MSVKDADQSGIDQVTLRYRRVTQFEDYKTAQMIFNNVSGKYESDTSANFFEGKYGVMYLTKVMNIK